MLTERLKESEEALETAQQREDAAPDGLMMLREQTRQHREHIRQTTDMTDAGAPARYHSTGTTLETRM
jgi:hypothetical protein